MEEGKNKNVFVEVGWGTQKEHKINKSSDIKKQ